MLSPETKRQLSERLASRTEFVERNRAQWAYDQVVLLNHVFRVACNVQEPGCHFARLLQFPYVGVCPVPIGWIVILCNLSEAHPTLIVQLNALNRAGLILGCDLFE